MVNKVSGAAACFKRVDKWLCEQPLVVLQTAPKGVPLFNKSLLLYCKVACQQLLTSLKNII